MLYGKFPTNRNLRGAKRWAISAKSTFNTSACTSCVFACCAQRLAKSRSNSMSNKKPTRCNNGCVSAPRPGPTSTIACCGCGAMDSSKASKTDTLLKKFWPKRFFALCPRLLFVALVRAEVRPILVNWQTTLFHKGFLSHPLHPFL